MHNDCPGRRGFAPFKSCTWFVGEGGGGGWLDEIDTMHKPTYMSPDSDSDFFEPLFLGLIYCFSDILLKLMLQHT